MRGITLVGATPNRLAIVYNLLAEAGEDGLERERLSALIGPVSLARDPEAGEDNALSDCLSAGEEMGVFRQDAGTIRLAQGAVPGGFYAAAETLAIDGPETTEEASGWLAGAVAWFLCQDPRRPLRWGGSSAVTTLRDKLGQGKFGMTNDSRFQQAVYWAQALGYVTRTPMPYDGVLSDPTQALERRLPVLLPEIRQERPIRAFLADLARLCPVLDGGRLRAEVEAGCGLTREPHVASPSLSLALVRLKLRGVLRFNYLDDADAAFIEGLHGGRASTVTRLEA